MTEQNVTPVQQEEKTRARLQNLFDWIEPALIALICAAILFAFVFRTVGVEGTSMAPTLKSNDRLLLTHLFYTPERGDIVVISRMDQNKTPLIKRVIALAGDTLEITADRKVYLNGELLDEPYLQGAETNPKNCIGKMVIPEGHIFVMGDNRMVSLDSRDISVGPVSLDRVMGKASFRLWEGFGEVS